MLYQFSHLKSQQDITHGFFDKEVDIQRNEQEFADRLELPKIMRLLQVHRNECVIINENDLVRKNALAADAMITAEKNIGLLIQVADCQALLVYDPEKKIIANIHAGWKSLVSGIIENTLQTMKDQFGSEVSDLIIGICPSLGPCCSDFSDPLSEIPKKYHQFCRETTDRKWVNLWAICRKQLTELGVDYKKQVERISECTKCNDNFFSYRKGGGRERMGAVIMMKQASLS